MRQSIYLATFLRASIYCNRVARGFNFCFIMFATIIFILCLYSIIVHLVSKIASGNKKQIRVG